MERAPNEKDRHCEQWRQRAIGKAIVRSLSQGEEGRCTTEGDGGAK